MSTPLVALNADEPVVPFDGHRANLDRDGSTNVDDRITWDRR